MYLLTVKINVLSIQEKKVNARSTKHQVHFGINHAISILISTLIDIIFVIFKNDKGILDYNKMQPRQNVLCCFLTVPLFDLQSLIVTFHGHSHFLANIVF